MVAIVLICSILPVNCRSGIASSCALTVSFNAKRPRSVSSARAETRSVEISGNSAIGAPGQARSPALNGASPPGRHVEIRLIIPAAGASNVILVRARSARCTS